MRAWLDHACARTANAPSKPMPPAFRKWRRECLSTVTGDSELSECSPQITQIGLYHETKSKALTFARALRPPVCVLPLITCHDQSTRDPGACLPMPYPMPSRGRRLESHVRFDRPPSRILPENKDRHIDGRPVVFLAGFRLHEPVWLGALPCRHC